ncbi:MAG: MFS transporter [Deltaproteobacteria bacterium]|nr:MFS transporter [Deltaproteobacteria bacterium]
MFALVKRQRSELLLFITAIALLGFGDSVINATLNNYLDETFFITSLERSLLEFPRELPGFLVVFISAALFFLRSRRLAVFACLVSGAGFLLIAFFAPTLHILFVWIFMYSVGQHLLMPLVSSITMEMANKGQDGRRLGQVHSIRNMAAVTGSFVVFAGFKYLGLNFQVSFIIASFVFVVAAFFFYRLSPGDVQPPRLHLKLHKQYRLYYWLGILFGTRKQIFLTFAPWVLVTVYNKPTTVIATLFFIGGIAGIVFQPLLGRAIDQLGEKFVFMAEAVLLVMVCLGYGFAKDLLPYPAAFVVVSVCFVGDQLLMSVNMARATYLKKIAASPEHITPTLTMSLTIDHIFSISVALVGGMIWSRFGYQFVFLFGGLIACLNLISALFVVVPDPHKASPPHPEAGTA